MTLITKPDFTYVWASGGAVVAPNDTKKQQGWVAEAPPFQYDNWLQNRQDQMLAHINQRGIPGWDGLTNYEAGGLSYVQGTNGVVYKSVAASGPSTTVQDPTTDVTDTYWTVAFASTTQATETIQGIIELATTAEAEAGLDDERAMTPLKVKQAIQEFASSSLPLGYFSGFTLTNNSGAPNTTIDISSGAARSSTNLVDIVSSSSTTAILQSSGAWTAGNNQNKLDTGARANNTEYHVFKIYKTSDGSSEDLFSLSPSAPTMPSGYSGFRRIGSVFTNGSGNLLSFINIGRRFYWGVLVRDVTATGVVPGTGNVILRVPTGVRVIAHTDVRILGENCVLFLSPTDTTAPSLAGTDSASWIAGVGTNNIGATNESVSATTECLTNTSGQVRLQTASGGNVSYVVTTKFWEEL